MDNTDIEQRSFWGLPFPKSFTVIIGGRRAYFKPTVLNPLGVHEQEGVIRFKCGSAPASEESFNERCKRTEADFWHMKYVILAWRNDVFLKRMAKLDRRARYKLWHNRAWRDIKHVLTGRRC